MKITTLGIDLAKEVFQVHGVDLAGNVIVRKKLTRKQLPLFMIQLEACLVGMEACSGAQYWRRRFEAMGHTVRLMNPQFVKPYVKTNKNDMNDAEAICEAVARPTMRFVPPKSIDQQDIQTLHRIRQGRTSEKVALSNRIRGMLAEYGVVIARNMTNLRKLLPEILEDSNNELTVFTRELFSELHLELTHVEERIHECDLKIERIFRGSEKAQRLAQIKGIGPITSTALLAAVGDPKVFKNGRQLSAWLGLVPRQSSSGGKNNLLGISKRGDAYIRTLLIQGAHAVVRHATGKVDRKSVWINQMVERKGTQRTCVAIANKNSRIAWALWVKEENYQEQAA